MTVTEIPTRAGHAVTVTRLGARQTAYSADCTCGATWHADMANEPVDTWAATHTTVPRDAMPTYDLRRRAYDASAGLRQLADFVTKHPEFVEAVEDHAVQLCIGTYGRTPHQVARIYREFCDLLGGLPSPRSDTDVYQGERRSFGPVTVEVFVNRQVIEQADA